MLKSRPNNKNFIDNYDKTFAKIKQQAKSPQKSRKTITQVSTIQTIETIDNAILDKAKQALHKIANNPELAKNPIVMMAVDHIHEELELVNEQLKAIENLEVIIEPKALVEAPIYQTPEEMMELAPVDKTQVVETDNKGELAGKGKMRQLSKLEKKY